MDAEYSDNAEETRQLDVGFAIFNTGDVALLATEFFGELLLSEVEFLSTHAEHVAIDPRERILVKLLARGRAGRAVFLVKRRVGG